MGRDELDKWGGDWPWGLCEFEKANTHGGPANQNPKYTRSRNAFVSAGMESWQMLA